MSRQHQTEPSVALEAELSRLLDEPIELPARLLQPTQETPSSLSSAQRAALEHVSAYAKSRAAEARVVQDEVRRMCDVSEEDLRDALSKVRCDARVVVHFHPDRPISGGETVAAALLRDDCYRSQFETRISNGGLTAHAGGQRDSIESQLFAGAYHVPGTLAGERPKYGSLDLLGHAEGASPRFGSCYLVLKSHVSRRCTFSYLDSHEQPAERGTLAEFDDILAALLRESFLRDFALGERDFDPPALIRRLRTWLPMPVGSPATPFVHRNLNHYIEAQIHGDVLVSRDVAALVADPSFESTEVGVALAALCERRCIPLFWHCGFRLAATEVPADFRGPTMPSLARRVAKGGYIDAFLIGEAVRDLFANPTGWLDRGTYSQALQELKLLWHVLVKHGRPTSPEGQLRASRSLAT